MASDKAVDIAVEYLRVRRQGGASIVAIVRDMKGACKHEGWDVGSPDELNPDAVTFWLALIYEVYIALADDE